MYVSFPDAARVRIDTLQISGTMSGCYEDVPDELAEELGIEPYETRLKANMQDRGGEIWGMREKVTCLAQTAPWSGPCTVWVWLDHPDPLKDGDGSQAFVVFTCDDPGDRSMPDTVQRVIDQTELRWADIATDYEH
jgi:hypothetical protein